MRKSVSLPSIRTTLKGDISSRRWWFGSEFRSDSEWTQANKPSLYSINARTCGILPLTWSSRRGRWSIPSLIRWMIPNRVNQITFELLAQHTGEDPFSLTLLPYKRRQVYCRYRSILIPLLILNRANKPTFIYIAQHTWDNQSLPLKLSPRKYAIPLKTSVSDSDSDSDSEKASTQPINNLHSTLSKETRTLFWYITNLKRRSSKCRHGTFRLRFWFRIESTSTNLHFTHCTYVVSRAF